MLNGKQPGRWLAAALLATLLAALWPAGAVEAGQAAQAGALQLEVRAGFDGIIKGGLWTPITITASNDGPDVSGELRVEVNPLGGARTVFARLIDLPTGSRKRVTLYAFDAASFSGEIQVDLVARGQVLAAERTRVQVINRPTLLIGVWSDSAGALAALASVTPTGGQTRVALLTADDLPDAGRGWEALDVLVISDADSGRLRPEQREALAEWISRGGCLLLTGGLSFQRTLAGLGDLTPVRASSSQPVSLDPLAGLAGQGQAGPLAGESPAAVGPLAADARLLAASGGVPLAAWRPMGAGRVIFLAADPALEPLRSWAGMGELWQALLTTGEQRPAWGYGFRTPWDSAQSAVAAVPGVTLPSVLQLCGFLALYVILIGPVNYLVLKRLHRTELAWFTVPALIVIFSVVAYVTGFQLRGTQAIVHRLAVIQTWPGSDTASVDGVIGVWSPRRARYDLLLEPGVLARGMPRDFGALAAVGETRIEQGTAFTLRGVQVDVGAVQPFVLEGFITSAPRLAGGLTIAPEADGLRLTGEIANPGPDNLDDAVIVLGGVAIPVGDLPAGQVLPIDELVAGGPAVQQDAAVLDPIPADAAYGYYVYGYEMLAGQVAGGDCYGAADLRRRCDLVNSVQNGGARGGGVYLFAWGSRLPIDTQVLNASASLIDTVLVVAELDAALAVSGGRVTVPPGLMTWRMLTEDYPYNTPYEVWIYPGSDYVVRFEPAALVPPLAVESAVVHLEDMLYSSGALPAVAVRNVQTGRWDTIQAGRGSSPIPAAAQYVDAAGGIEIRLSAAGASVVTLTRFDVTLEGRIVGEE